MTVLQSQVGRFGEGESEGRSFQGSGEQFERLSVEKKTVCGF